MIFYGTSALNILVMDVAHNEWLGPSKPLVAKSCYIPGPDEPLRPVRL